MVPFRYGRPGNKPRFLVRSETLESRMAQLILQPLPVLDFQNSRSSVDGMKMGCCPDARRATAASPL